MGKKLKIALFLPAAAVIVFLAVYLLLLRPDGPKGYVESTGVMEATEVNLSPKISGRIEWLCCEEGGKVEAGALAMRLESAELLARVEEGRAALAAAGEALAEARVSLENAMAAKESAGFEVEAFGSVDALLARGVPDRDACLVLDVDLPGIGGIELKRTLVEAGRDLPTIFITALEDEAVDEPLAALAPVAVLHKPFNKQDLLAAIGRAWG